MVATIIVGFDGSPAARSAGRVVRKLVGRSDAQLVLTGVRAPFPSFATPALPGVKRVTRSMVSREEHEQLLAALQRFRDELGLSNSRVRAEVGAPAERLTSVADEEAAELIVVGTRGQGAARAALLGTVAGDLFANSPVPVLAVPTDAPDEELQRIVCGVVDTAESMRAAAAAERLARDLGCTLVLVHVVKSGEDAAQAEVLLGNVAGALEAPGDVQRVVRTGAVAAELVAVADERGSAVIAVGPRGRGAVRAALLGSTSRDILSAGRYALLATPRAAVDRVLAKERSRT